MGTHYIGRPHTNHVILFNDYLRDIRLQIPSTPEEPLPWWVV